MNTDARSEAGPVHGSPKLTLLWRSTNRQRGLPGHVSIARVLHSRSAQTCPSALQAADQRLQLASALHLRQRWLHPTAVQAVQLPKPVRLAVQTAVSCSITLSCSSECILMYRLQHLLR